MTERRTSRPRLAWLRTPRALAVIACILLVPNALLLAEKLAWEIGIADLAEDSAAVLAGHATALRRELDKYEALPAVVAMDHRVRWLLSYPDDALMVEVANEHLEAIAGATGASDVYVMDPSGVTVAASNWHGPAPFVGRNFSFRPYFLDALAGVPGSYFALGSTSHRRGYYFSHPVRSPNGVSGVAVVKVSMADLEAAWAAGPDELMVTDADGVVFLASQPEWSFRTLEALPAETLRRIVDTRQYAGAEIAPLELLSSLALDRGARLVRLPARAPARSVRAGVEYLMLSREMPGVGWTVHILSETAPVRHRVVMVMFVSGLALALAMLMALIVFQRADHERERARLQAQSHSALQIAHGELESLVAERTEELVETNERLAREVEERLEAERELRSAHDDLVQAGKLAALGQMATEITHELNQPLAAIRSYADNAGAFIERGRTPEAAANLTIIGELTARMAKITSQLKSFARKSPGEPGAVRVADVIDSVVTLLEPRLSRHGVELDRVRPGPDCQVLGDRIRLEQVMVNLCQNAIDAMLGAQVRRLAIAVDADASRVRIRVTDTGRGIDEGALPKLFEPYFTTKDVGAGLGLGLAITYGIVKDHRGTIDAANRAEGGAAFTVTLPRARSEGARETGQGASTAAPAEGDRAADGLAGPEPDTGTAPGSAVAGDEGAGDRRSQDRVA